MKSGDLVTIINKRCRSLNQTGMLVKRTYLAYDNKFSRWNVLKSDGSLVSVSASRLRLV